MMKRPQVVGGKITTVAVPLDGALAHSDGLDSGFGVRNVVELETDAGLVGLGEVGPRVKHEELVIAARELVGLDIFDVQALHARLRSEKFYQMSLAMVEATFEMALLDVQGKYAGVRVADLLGGVVRGQVPMIGYVYRKEQTEYGERVQSTDEVVEHVRRLVTRYGFRTVKVKAGVAAPMSEVETVRALREAFPEVELRVDPNGAWSVPTALNVCRELEGARLEWLEDPVLTRRGMGEVARRVAIPLATNMCCIQPLEFPDTICAKAIDVLLVDLWYTGGLRQAKQMAAMCRTFGVDVGIHAGGGACELGIGLAAELQVAASLPSLVHAADAEYHHLSDDIIKGGLLGYSGGCLALPEGPGLGVNIDQDRLGKYADLYQLHVAQARPAGSFPAYPIW